MIARIWHGTVPISKGDEYVELMREMRCPTISIMLARNILGPSNGQVPPM
jgi:hypothetical protein